MKLLCLPLQFRILPLLMFTMFIQRLIKRCRLNFELLSLSTIKCKIRIRLHSFATIGSELKVVSCFVLGVEGVMLFCGKSKWTSETMAFTRVSTICVLIFVSLSGFCNCDWRDPYFGPYQPVTKKTTTTPKPKTTPPPMQRRHTERDAVKFFLYPYPQ